MSKISISKIGARSFSIDQNEYPFQSQWFVREEVAMHYLDEGSGLPVLMLHGNPTWSFMYRHVINGLKAKFRIIAPDYIGFGFSDHPTDFGYTPQEHADWINALVIHLKLEKFILMIHDWGGPIGMAVAHTNPTSISGLVICNTWSWPLRFYKPPFHWAFSILFGGSIGKYLVLKRNFFARRILMMGLSYRLKTPEILKAYTDPFPTPQTRIGTYIFPKRLRMSDSWLNSIRINLNAFNDRPVELVWGMKDPVFGRESMIKNWLKYLPNANVCRIPDARHLVPEENPEELIAAVTRLQTEEFKINSP